MRYAWLLIAMMSAGASAQWTMQESHTTASLRGIHSLGKGVAWASGTGGTVLRTVDGGNNWQVCAVPPEAEKLDFRGVQAFDASTAIVMSSGKGDLSRLYKTVDGCETWRLVFTNPDKDGFWDAVQAHTVGPIDKQVCPADSGHAIAGSIFGDPAIHKASRRDTTTQTSFFLSTFTINSSCSQDALSPSAGSLFTGPGEAAFAASNSVLFQPGPNIFWMATDRELIQYEVGVSSPHNYEVESLCGMDFALQRGASSRGAFSFAVRPDSVEQPKPSKLFSSSRCLKADIVAVGGDYVAPNERGQTAVFTGGNNKFQPAKTMPGGYRSAVTYDNRDSLWITVGPNGTDVSTDDGRNWRALKPGAGEPADADKNWNALSLPFVVGPKGRIGVLRGDALKRP